MSYLNEIKQNLESLLKREGSVAVAIRALDAALAAHGSALDPQLQHYLVQRSYDKALLYLNALLGQAAPDGAAQVTASDTARCPDSDPAALRPPPGGCSGRRVRG